MDKKEQQIIIGANIINGLGAATKTLCRQLPLIANEFPEIAECYHGSINVKLEVPLLVLVPDHRTKPITWSPSKSKTEIFDFVRIELELPNYKSFVPAWLYIPHNSPHRKTDYVHEVIAMRLDLVGVDYCRIKINRSALKFSVLVESSEIIVI